MAGPEKPAATKRGRKTVASISSRLCRCVAPFFAPHPTFRPQISKEGDSFPVPLTVATMSELVKSMMDEDNEDDDEDGGDGGGNAPEIPLPNVKSEVLKKVIEFCDHHLGEPMTEIEKPLKSQNMADVVQKWYADFVDLEQVLLFELILAANYMDIKPLLDLTCATVASMIKGKTVSKRGWRRVGGVGVFFFLSLSETVF